MKVKNLLSILLTLLFYLPNLPAQTLTRLVLVNAQTNEDITDLEDGLNINLNETGSSLNVRAEVSGAVGSIQFRLDAVVNFRVENVAPYAMAGDTNGDYKSWTPTLGSHAITATAFAGTGATGEQLDELTVVFTVSEDEIDIDQPDNPGTGTMTMDGELKKWHKLTFSFDGPALEEKSVGPNPFLDYRLNVLFKKGNRTFVVPGYFAADGNAAETSADAGNVWRVHFAPDEIGEWVYEVSFRLGNNLAINENPNAGTPVSPLDGVSGTFTITPTDKQLPDNRARGQLKYVNVRYLQFAETGEFFLKGGADAPENFLAYEDFDDTPNNGNRRKTWAPHKNDWQTGDPSWQNGKGTEIIGAINYLASKGINVFSFLTMNINGDDKNVYPYVSADNFRHFDCSKLDQWEIVFEHADRKGMYLHFKTQETENDQLLDNGNVGTLRSLYYRELLARFGHHLSLNWNMGEENSQSSDQQADMAAWFQRNDPYGHHRVVHTHLNGGPNFYTELTGNQSDYTGISLQATWNRVHELTTKWLDVTENSAKSWVIANDEQGNAGIGVPPDLDYPNYNGSNPDLHDIRKEVLWGHLMAGGAGLEYYFGYNLPDSDLTLENFRSRDQSWDYMRYALDFFRALPFVEMSAEDNLVTEGWCFAKTGEHYAIYLKNGGSTKLTLADDKNYQVRWYNPRTGEYTEGNVELVTGAGQVDLGSPPFDSDEDWAILVQATTTTSVEDFPQSHYFTIAPNPTHTNFQLELAEEGQAIFRMLSLDGKLVQQQFISERWTSIELQGLPTGTYLVEVQQEGRVDRQFLLVQ